MKFIVSVLPFLLIMAGGLHGQAYGPAPCSNNTQPELENYLKSKIPFLVPTAYGGQNDKLLPIYSAASSTSILPPEGRPPHNPGCYKKGSHGHYHLDPTKNCETGEVDETKAIEHDLWTCMYSPAKAWDGNLSTAWVEGVPGPGTGEILIVHLNPSRSIKIRPGIAANSKLFVANNRPRKIRLYLLGVQELQHTQTSLNLNEVVVVRTFKAELLDRNEWQRIRPQWADRRPGVYERFILGIEILSVYPGKKFDHTGISEVAN